jgi:uncharacterized phiE125 gp8 family phage protein
VARYAVTTATAPTSEPITLAEAKAHLRVVGNDDDSLISRLITAVREAAELYTNRQIITASLVLYIDQFPSGEAIYLPKNPVQSVTAFNYTDANNVSQVLSTSVYRTLLNREPAEIRLKSYQQWPATYGTTEQVWIQYVAGYGTAASVPQMLKQGMLLLLGDLYEHRESTTAGTLSEIPRSAERIFDQYRVGDEFHSYARSL